MAFLTLSVLAMSGDTIRFAYLPIYMELQLGTPDWLRGLVIASQSVAMLVFIPIMGVLADRFGAHRLVVVNVLLGVAANVGFAVADSELMLIGATVLHAAMWATLGGIGITVAQDLYPSGIGLASSLSSPRSGSPPPSAVSPARWASAGSVYPGCSSSPPCSARWPPSGC